MSERLAIAGGAAVRGAPWPRWPISSDATLANVREVLDGGRWTISGAYQGVESFERRFARAFAAYCDTAWCVPTSSGTASLMVALEACGVGAGDEVVVPALSWVASASAVLAINAVPVLADVDPDTLCLCPASLAASITPRTRAITVVHLYSAVADLDALLAIAARHGLPLVEDCAQAHGARHRERPVGSHGVAGAFSMQHSKLLTCGEGGAVVTSDAALARRMEHLRADGRTFREPPPPAGQMELVETAELMGHNFCLSELHAAVLLAQLDKLEAEHERRRANAALLDAGLRALGCRPQATSTGTSRRVHYEYAVALPPEVVARVGLSRFAAAVSAELGVPVRPIYRPLHASPLYRPRSRRRFALGEEHLARVDPGRFSLPHAQHAHAHTLSLRHQFLLGPRSDMEDIVEAFAKVLRNLDAVGRLDDDAVR